MARQTINIGAAPNDGTGDSIRDGGDKINDNFIEVYGYSAAWPQFTTTTSTTAYVGTPNPSIAAYATGQRFQVKIHATSTGSATLNLNSVGAKKVFINPTTQAGSGNLVINQVYLMVYDEALDSASGGFLMVGGGGGAWGAITGTLSAQTDLQTALDAKVDEETFTTLSDGSTVVWDTSSKQCPMGKLTSTQSFTLDFQNLKNGATGIFKLVTDTGSAITMTFDAGYTNKSLNTTFTTYTFPALTAQEYFLSFVVDGTTIEWTIGDITPELNVIPYAFVQRVADQSLSNATDTPIAFDTEDIDNSAIFNIGSPTRLTIPGTGDKIAHVSGVIRYASNATGLRRAVIFLNGVWYSEMLIAQNNANTATFTFLNFDFQVPCTAGDYIEVAGYQNSTGSLNARASVQVSFQNR